MEDFINTFHIDWKLMVAQIINFGLVFAIFYFLASKPLSKLVKDRTKEIETGLADAKENAIIAQKTKKEYEEVLAKARIEANKVFQDGKKEAEAKKVSMMEEAKNEVKVMVENGKKSLETEKAKMLEDVKKEIGILTTLAAEKILSSKKDLNSL